MAKLLALFAVLLAARLCHTDLLWIEEAYPTAAAAEMLRGKFLYRDIWFDKPPLYALVYVLWHAKLGVALRAAGALYVLLCCWLAYRFARARWGGTEALASASLLAFFLTFGIPSSVMALAPDLLMIAPHLGAIYLAWRGRAFLAGIVAGVALLVNVKGVFVLAAAMVFLPPQGWLWLAAGFALPNAACAAVLWANGAWTSYLDQVWRWGFLYSNDPMTAPLAEGVKRTLHWAGFHALLVLGAAFYFRRERDWRFLLWAALSLVAVAGGWRFFPRYYFHLLPVAVLAGARGYAAAPKALRWGVLALLLVPFIRFGPRYIQLATGQSSQWSDTAMMRDSRSAGEWLRSHARGTDTLLVWGYRPDLFAFSGLAAGTPYLDSQPLTGVLADRHLASSQPTAAAWAARNRARLVETKPTWIADGLGPYNPELSVARYQDLAGWLAEYEEVYRTSGFILYKRRTGLSSSRTSRGPRGARAWGG